MSGFDMNAYVDSMIDDAVDDDFVDDNDTGNTVELENNNGSQQQENFQQDQQQQQERQQQRRTEENDFDTQLREEINQSHNRNRDTKTATTQQQQQQDQQQQQLRPLGDGSFTNQRGDITDDKGNVIAQRGFARRMYETNQRNTVRIQEQDRIINQLQTSAAEHNAIRSAAQNYGLDTNELSQAVDYAGRIKRGDLIGVAKDIVAMAVAAGNNVTDILGSDVGDSVDMRALHQMISQVTTPMQQQQQQQRQQQEIHERATAQYNNFIARHPYADVHQNDIAQMAQAQGIDAQQAYYEIRAFAQQHGLDFSLPLGEQIKSRGAQQQQQQPAQQQRPQNNQRQQRRPLPNQQTSATMSETVTEAPSNASWAEIIRSAQGK